MGQNALRAQLGLPNAAEEHGLSDGAEGDLKRRFLMTEKIIKVAYPRKGLKMELRYAYNKRSILDKRVYRLIIWNNVRALCSDGIWHKKQEALDDFGKLYHL